MKITIQGALPSLNKYLAAYGRNRYIAGKMKKDATELVAWQVKQMPEIKHQADYTFTWYVANKRTDPDNTAAFGTKVILDGLQVAGKLPNDSLRWIRSITHFFEIGEPKVEVEIDEA